MPNSQPPFDARYLNRSRPVSQRHTKIVLEAFYYNRNMAILL